MKHIWCVLTLALSLSAQATETSNPDIHSSSARTFQKIVSAIHSMADVQQLEEFVQPLIQSFSKLKEQGMMVSLIPHEFQIVAHHFKTTKEHIPGVRWDNSGLITDGMPCSRDFFEMYMGLQGIQRPHGKMSFSTMTGPDSEQILTYLKAVYPYSIIPNQSSSGVEFIGLSQDSRKIKKIYRHFEGIQKSIVSIPHGKIWYWIEMRYHVEKLHHHMHETTSMVKLPMEANEQIFANFFPKKSGEIKSFLQEIKEFTVSVNQIAELFVKPVKSRWGTETPCYRTILKVFFNQFPQLNILENLKDDQGKGDKVMDFWKLYLELHKDYSHKNRQVKGEYDTEKLSHLCNKLLAPKHKYDHQDIERTLIQIPDVKVHFKGIMVVFSNPFTPKLTDVLGYNFFLDNISNALKRQRQDQVSQASSPTSQSSKSIFSAWW